MSAIHLPAAHIAAICGTVAARCIQQGKSFDTRQIGRLAVILATENARSINTRYPDDGAQPLVPDGALLAHYLVNPLTDSQLAAALRSYEYQSCETHDYERTPAFQACAQIWAHFLPLQARDWPIATGDWVIDAPANLAGVAA